MSKTINTTAIRAAINAFCTAQDVADKSLTKLAEKMHAAGARKWEDVAECVKSTVAAYYGVELNEKGNFPSDAPSVCNTRMHRIRKAFEGDAGGSAEVDVVGRLVKAYAKLDAKQRKVFAREIAKLG